MGGVINFASDYLHLRNERRGVCRIERRVSERQGLSELLMLVVVVDREVMKRNALPDVDDGNDELIVKVGSFERIFPYSRGKW